MPEITAAEMTLKERLTGVQARIQAACIAAGRLPDSVRLVAVSKTHPASVILEALVVGLQDFGENRLEEAGNKIAEVAAQKPAALPVRWHMIGHVQSRKARLVVPNFDLVHSVDSVKLAEKLARLAVEEGIRLDVLLEINISGEEAKYGWQAHHWDQRATVRESLWTDIRSMLMLPGLRLCGLMTMAPLVDDMEVTRPVFAGLRRLCDALQADFPAADWQELSMGMSDDFPVAIEEGATLVRIGRAIFGERA